MSAHGSLLSVLDPGAVAILRQRGIERTFEEGSFLMRQGDLAGAMYLILEGTVRVERRVPAVAAPLHIADLGPGDIVGEIAIVIGGPRAASVRALSRVATIELSHEATLEAVLELPGLPVVLRQIARRRLEEIDHLSARMARYVSREPGSTSD